MPTATRKVARSHFGEPSILQHAQAPSLKRLRILPDFPMLASIVDYSETPSPPLSAPLLFSRCSIAHRMPHAPRSISSWLIPRRGASKRLEQPLILHSS